MDFYKLFGFFKILKESIKLLPRNGKVMSVIAILSLLLSCLIYFSFSYSVLSLTQDMLDIQKSMIPDPSSFNASDPTSFAPPDLTPSQLADLLDRIKQITILLYAVEIVFVIVFFIISFFTTIAIILVSAISYTGNTLSIKDLFYRIARSWKGPFVTSISVSVYSLGYFIAVGIFVVPMVLIYQNIITLLLAVLVGIVGFIFYLYLFVILTLAIVVSVTEENCYGMVAMGKASTLVKGQRLNGYMLNIFFTLLGSIVSLLVFGQMGLGTNLKFNWVSVLVVIFGCLVKIYQMVAYTVLYFHCKNHHGEDSTEIYGIVKYASLPTTSNHLNA